MSRLTLESGVENWQPVGRGSSYAVSLALHWGVHVCTYMCAHVRACILTEFVPTSYKPLQFRPFLKNQIWQSETLTLTRKRLGVLLA